MYKMLLICLRIACLVDDKRYNKLLYTVKLKVKVCQENVAAYNK